MATDFSYNNTLITSSGPFKPKNRNVPMNARYRVETYADIANIPVPAVGELVFVLSDENNDNQQNIYVIKSLKASTMGVADSLVNEVVPLKTFLGTDDIDLSDYVTEDELNSKGYATIAEVDQKIADIGTSGTVNLSEYQKITDDTLSTSNKTITGAINEVNSNLVASLNGKKISDPMTKEEYDALTEKDPNMIYLVDDDDSIIGLPDYSSSDANKVLAVNSNGTALAWINKSTTSISLNGTTYNQVDGLITLPNYPSSSSEGANLFVSIEDYPRLTDETDDSPRIQRAFNANENNVIYFPMGTYDIASTVTGVNISMDCHPRAIFNATGSKGSMFELTYEGEYSESFKGNYQWRHFYINRGEFDCNDVMDGIKTYDGHNVVFRDCLITNAKSKGLWIAPGTSTSKYYVHNVTCRGTTINSLSNTAFYIEGSDHHFVDCTVADFTKAFYCGGGGAHRMVRCHHWITQASRLNSSVAFNVNSGGCTFLDCYLDTVKIGFDIYNDVQTFNCAGFNNFKYGLTGNVYYKMNVYNRNVVINGGNFNDSKGKFWGGYTPNEQTIIQNLNGSCDGLIQDIKQYNVTSKISDSTVKGYGFMTLDFTLFDTGAFNFTINLVNKEGLCEIYCKVIKNSSSCKFKWYGDNDLTDRIKVINTGTLKYEIVYIPIDTDDILIFKHTIPIGYAKNSDSTAQGMKYLHSLGIINSKTDGTVYMNNITSNLVTFGVDNFTSLSNETINVTGVSINKTEATVNINDTLQLTATVQPTNASNKIITWSTDHEQIATVDNNGLVTPVSEGSCNITATTQDGSHTATCRITVDTSDISVTGISLNKKSLNLNINGNEKLTYIISPSGATNKNVTWLASNENCTVVDGLVTGISTGSCIITVTTQDGNFQDSCNVIVSEATTLENNEASFLNNFAQTFCTVCDVGSYYEYVEPNKIHVIKVEDREKTLIPEIKLLPNQSYTLTFDFTDTDYKISGGFYHGDTTWGSNFSSCDIGGISQTIFTTNDSGSIRIKPNTVPSGGTFIATLTKK